MPLTIGILLLVSFSFVFLSVSVIFLKKMAKSVRASVSKRNSAKLRATVFGPADNARTERLSAKLQELASQPKSTDHEMKVNGMCVAHDCQSPPGSLYILIDIQIQMSRANPRKPKSRKQVKVIIPLNNTVPFLPVLTVSL